MPDSTCAFGDSIDAKFFGENRVRFDPEQFEKSVLDGIEDQVFHVAIHGLGQIPDCFFGWGSATAHFSFSRFSPRLALRTRSIVFKIIWRQKRRTK
jgi:hypothetical protein